MAALVFSAAQRDHSKLQSRLPCRPHFGTEAAATDLIFGASVVRLPCRRAVRSRPRRLRRRANARRLCQLVRIVVRGALLAPIDEHVAAFLRVPRALPCRSRKFWRLGAEIVASNCADLPLFPPVHATNASVPPGLLVTLGCAIATASAPSVLGAVA